MCEFCKHWKCSARCPNYEPIKVCECDECGESIYVGDTAYKIGNRYYCESCCEVVEVEETERDDDLAYELWRDRRMEKYDG